MNTDRLRFDLADLAEEVTPVDLRDRVLRTSRRLGIQRAVATSAAVVVLLGVATGTAFAIRPTADGSRPQPADSPSVTVAPTPVEVTPIPSPSESVPVSPTSTAPTPTIGRIFYGPAPGASNATSSRLRSWRPDSPPVAMVRLPMDSALLNAAVSPNGERVAWVENTDLWVAAIDGSGKRKLRGGVDNTCWTPAWSPDSRELAVGLVTPDNPGVYQAATIDQSTGTVREAGRTEGCHPVWSGDGTLIAYADGTDGGINLAAPDGANRRSVPGLGGKARYSTFDLASLSPDGHQIALYRRGPGMESGDVARELTVNVVLDTRTGAEIKLPLEDRDLLQAYFQSDGTLVARVKFGDHNLLVLIGEDGQKISETREPAELRNMQILAVTR